MSLKLWGSESGNAGSDDHSNESKADSSRVPQFARKPRFFFKERNRAGCGPGPVKKVGCSITRGGAVGKSSREKESSGSP